MGLKALPHDHVIILRDGKSGIALPRSIHSAKYVASKYFDYAGKLIAHSVVHAGFALVRLSKAK